ncbi:chemotaxis protein CheW [Candidatus Methylospira mobilis]|uniref:Chemotaxis protein CheW n=1 Tax=Candidatus Methylospira mobilis TaxID=1808979 RepID=A0A5Q0BJM6_9GAMM|nr:chemotaxis protein CheW [Candidatus Methylospira mobilis]QFY42367.1 chemotaxis protein CheW [Candidatus Methylospira mobilis]
MNAQIQPVRSGNGALATQAALLAASGNSKQEQHQYLTFVVGGEAFAIGILHIKEIIEYGQLTEVPRMPIFIRGVINLRGSVVPVIDLKACLGKAISQITRRSCIIIVEVDHEDEKHDIGVLVDAVSAVLEIPTGDIEPAPAFGARIRTDYIAGMGKVDGKFVILLNIGAVLSLDDMAALASVGDQADTVASPEGARA